MTEPAPPPPHDEPAGGDPVCWAHLLCPECGAVPDRPDDERCSRCGAEFPAAEQQEPVDSAGGTAFLP